MIFNDRFSRGAVMAGLLLLLAVSGTAAAAEPPPGSTTPPVGTATATATVPTLTEGQRIRAELAHELARVQPLLDRYGYGAVALAVGAEGAGIPTPGQTLLIAAAVDAAAHPRLQIGWLLLVAFLAAALGNSVGYLIGRVGGRALLRRLRVDPRHLARVEAAFDRWGGWLIAGARFFDGLRQLNGIAAGILEMPWWRFTGFNLLGAALWVGFWGLGFYYLEAHLHGILALVRRSNPWVLAGTLTVLALALVLLWLRVRRTAPGGNPAAGG